MRILLITSLISYASCYDSELARREIRSAFDPSAEQIAEYKALSANLNVTLLQLEGVEWHIKLKVQNNNPKAVTIATHLSPLDRRENLVHIFDYPHRPENTSEIRDLLQPRPGQEWVTLPPGAASYQDVHIDSLQSKDGVEPGYQNMKLGETMAMQVKGRWLGVWEGGRDRIIKKYGVWEVYPIKEKTPGLDSLIKMNAWKEGKSKGKKTMGHVPNIHWKDRVRFKSNILNVIIV